MSSWIGKTRQLQSTSITQKNIKYVQQGRTIFFAAFCLFMEKSPKNCGLLGRNRNTLKLKTTAKLKDKRTSITTVRGLYRMYATFRTPLGSHYRLPLNSALSTMSKRKHKHFDIEAYYLNKTKTFWFRPLIVRTNRNVSFCSKIV
jgi:hypothetical protein